MEFQQMFAIFALLLARHIITYKFFPMRNAWRYLPSLILVFGLSAPVIRMGAQSFNCADPAFGDNGAVRLNCGSGYELGKAMDYQSDGKIIIAGEAGSSPRFFLQRYFADGTPDHGFGEADGYTLIADPNTRILDDVLVLPGDDILLAFTGSYGFGNTQGHYLYKFHSNGTLDHSFGQNGLYKIANDNTYTDWDHTLFTKLPGGKFIVAGAHAGAFVIARFEADARPDSTFGVNGLVINQISNLSYFNLNTLECDPSGNIWAGGYDPNYGVMLKFLPNGAIDNSFGINGRLNQDFISFQKTRMNRLKIVADTSCIAMSTVTYFNTGTGVDEVHLFLSKYRSNGALDLTFGNNGQAHEILSSVKGNFNDIMILADGSIISVGWIGAKMAAFQHDPSGQIDPDFGTNGLLLSDYGKIATNRFLRLSRHPFNLKIYGLGITNNSFPLKQNYAERDFDIDITLTRFNPDFTPDTGYGVEGKRTGIVLNPDETAYAVARQNDGKLIVVVFGSSSTVLMRLNPDGQIDRSFGNFGKVSLFLFRVFGEECIKLYNNKIILAGSGDHYAALYELNADGTPDLSFGTEAKAEVASTTNFERGNALGIQNGKIILAGSTYTIPINPADFKAARFNLNGVLDQTFGMNGIATISVGTSNDEAQLLKIRPNGKIILIGRSQVGNKNFPSFAQLTTNGSLDNTFGSNGKYIASSPNISILPTSAELLDDGSLVITGGDVLALKITTTGILDSSFAKDGVIESYDVYTGGGPINPHSVLLLDNYLYFGGTYFDAGDSIMVVRCKMGNGALSSPCGLQDLSFHPDLYSGYNEFVYSVIKGPDNSILLLGNADYYDNTVNNDPILIQLTPEAPVQLFALPSPLIVSSLGGSRDLLIGGECGAWTITENSSWITNVNPASGNTQQNTEVTVYFSKNTDTLSRTANLILSGCSVTDTVLLIQPRASLTVYPSSLTVGPAAGTIDITVSGICQNWTVNESIPWLSVSPMSGSQNGVVTVTYQANPSPNPLSGSIYITGCNYTYQIIFTQSGTVDTKLPEPETEPRLWPNPAQDGFFIELAGKSSGSCHVKLSDAFGRVVQEMNLPKGRSSWIAREGLPAGVYQVVIAEGLLLQGVRKVVLID